MGLLQQLWQKSEGKRHSLGICIPDASRGKREARVKEEAIAGGRGFIVLGIFHVHDSLMVQGEAYATIRKKDKVGLKGKKLVVHDIQVEGKSTGLIKEGQMGALFLKAEKGKQPIIRIGDTLLF